MADLSYQMPAVIIDPTTPSQQMGVDPSGHAQVDIAAVSVTLPVATELADAAALSDAFANPTTAPVGAFMMGFDGTDWERIYAVADGDAVAAGTTGFLLFGHDGANYQAINVNASGHVSINDGGNTITVDGAVTVSGGVDTELPAAASLADNTANPTVPAVGAFIMLWDGATWDRAPGSAADGLLVNLGTNNDVTFSGAVDTELPAAAALADDVANPTVPGVGAFLMGWDGATWDRIAVANGGRPQVDVITGGGSDSPTTPVTTVASSTNTAAGASANLDSAELGGTTRKIWQVDLWASVPWKATIHAMEDGASVKQYTTVGGDANKLVTWRPPHRDFASEAFSANAGFDGFRAVMTNMHPNKPADLHWAVHHSA